MFIKDVVMDGFKCYSEKTTIKNLDKSFTAITGMNGSGKSNIIDAIIFAFDLCSSKLMRVASLKELINIKRQDCSVTLVLDNRDKTKTPSGYDSHDMITITRQMNSEGISKYKINGTNSTKTTIEKFAAASGITNDFIVMQGHITKILNMKSGELRGMIEEAAGTKNYNAEKEKAKLQLEKKEAKLREAQDHLKRSINPFMNDMLAEKKLYEENRNYEIRKEEVLRELQHLENKKLSGKLSGLVAELKGSMDEFIQDNEELNDVEEKIREYGEDGIETDLVEIKTGINEEKMKLEDLLAVQLENAIAEKQNEQRKMESRRQERKYNKPELQEQEKILSKEMVSSEGLGKINELEALKQRRGRNSAELRQLEMAGVENRVNGKRTENSVEWISEMKNKIKENSSMQKRYEEKSDRMETYKAKFNYPFIDGVYGTVDENFLLTDNKYQEAIYTILGGRAKFIICRDDGIASGLLKSCDRRISCIPLNKITVFPEKNIRTNGISAISLLKYDRAYEKAFLHIFNNFYVFEDKREASKCCYENKVVCVTLDGTVYDPRGTLTGGKINIRVDVVSRAELQGMENELKEIRSSIMSAKEVAELQSTLSKIEKKNILEKELVGLNERISLLEKICSKSVDVHGELEKIRNLILLATEEENNENLLKKKIDKISLEIKAMENKNTGNKMKIAESMERLKDLQDVLKREELKNSSKKVSVKMIEGFDLRKKNLIKSTVGLKSKIKRLVGEINGMEDVIEVLKTAARNVKKHRSRENNENSFNKESYNESLGNLDKLTEQYYREFNINPEILEMEDEILSSEEINSMETRINVLKAQISAKPGRITMNPRNFELLEKNAALINDLEGKIQKLEQDKRDILRTIDVFNGYGVSENKRAFEHVNLMIGKFLRYFLPDADVKISEDYEIKVMIGTWKDSLTELSGGQRSLIALCLIFSMLTYKPAPFYIFDEIDAALDLNYTQGIGEIIKKEFGGAQFIVVSLKNNMFENANRIYKVFIQDLKPRVAQIK
ncbi:structural maintenance of chromosome 2 [Enteropsectra breve]|nr:structural maintenance of chromosome 2 [Enteropsectra breve]